MAGENSTMAMNNDERGDSVPSHLFVELTSLAELSFPTTASSRIKYTCVGASPHILAVGSSSGTVYLFSRYAAKNRKSLCNVPVQVIPCQEGAITLVEISPDEKSVAVATSRGFICVLNISRNHSTMILNSVLHVGSEVTCFRFSLNGSRLFTGDSLGRVSCSRLSNKLSLRSPCELILRLDSRIVQIDHFHSQLLLSTLSRCYLQDMARQTTCQIGSKLRNGIYGACFFDYDEARDRDNPSVSMESSAAVNNYSPLIFCARPGGRIWEVDGQGKVYSTHQFGSIRSTWGIAGFREFGVSSIESASSVTFGTVNVVSEFILSAGGRTLTLVDPKRGKLVLVADAGEDFAQFCVCGNDVFLLTADGYLRKVTLFPLEKAIEKLQFRERFNAAAQVVCAVYNADKTYHFRLDVLQNIRTRLEGLPEAAELLQKIESIVAETANESTDNSKVSRVPQVARLTSGIHKVVKGMENSGYEDDFTFRMPMNRRGERGRRDCAVSRSPYSSLTRRSKSTSAVNNLSVAGGATGNGETFVDVQLDGELENVMQVVSVTYDDDSGSGKVSTASDFRTLVDCGMKVSRSEEALVELLDDRHHQEYEYSQNEFEGESRRTENVATSLSCLEGSQSAASSAFGRSKTHKLPPAAASCNQWSRTSQAFSESSSIIDDPLAINSAALKETLRTGGKFLIEAVQKLSLLSMGPDSCDPAYLVNGSNGLYENDDDEPEDEDDVEPEVSMVSDSSFAQFIPEAELNYGAPEPMDQKPLAETPIVQRVLHSAASGRVRVKRVKKGGKANGFVVGDGATAAGIPRGALEMETKNAAAQLGGTDGKTIDGTAVNVSSAEPIRRLRCEYCGLHNTWRFVLTVGPLLPTLNLSLDCYKEGGVPISRDAWRDLIGEWTRMKTVVALSNGLCSDCTRLWSSWFYRQDVKGSNLNAAKHDRTARALESVLASVPDSTLTSVFHRSTQQRLLDRSAATRRGSDTMFDISSEKIDKTSHSPEAAISTVCRESDATAAREDDTVMAVSMYYNPLYESVYNGESGDLDDRKDTWRWLSAAPLDVLLAVGVKVIGIDAIVEILLDVVPEYGDELSGAFYQFISCASDTVSMNTKVLESIALDAFGLSDALSNETGDKRGVKAVRINVRDFCPCCTLPLTATVAENDQRIFVFECGHSYHKICLLSHAKPPYSCLVCTLASS